MTELTLLMATAAVCAFVLATVNSLVLLARAPEASRATTSPSQVVDAPYAGPSVGEHWPLPLARNTQAIVAISPGCPPCDQLLTSLTSSPISGLQFALLGSDGGDLPAAIRNGALTGSEARQVGFRSAPYAVAVQDGRVVAHGSPRDAEHLGSWLRASHSGEATSPR
jgi:hypothetical protein